jgi:ethanolamine-phosphate cytidylyltransferase
MKEVHSMFRSMGVPPPYPDAERLAISLATGIFTLLAYFILFGKRHRRRRKFLQEELAAAYEKVHELSEKLAEVLYQILYNQMFIHTCTDL